MALQTKTISADGARGRQTFALTVTENSTNIEKNSSSVSWSLVISKKLSGWSWSSSAGKVKYSVVINGKTYSGTIPKYDGSSTVTIASGTETLEHNADGTKSISFSFSITDNPSWTYGPGNASASGTMTLTNIPRAATLTGVPDFNDEENPTITYRNPAGSAVTSVQACISLDGTNPTITYRDLEKVETSYQFNLTDEERKVLRAATTGSNNRTVYFRIKTVIGSSTLYHTEPCTYTIINGLPTLNPSVYDTNSDSVQLTGNSNIMIRYFNSMKYNIGASVYKEAEIVSQSITYDGKIATASTGDLGQVNTNVFVFSVTDNRGNTESKTITVPMVEYVPLTCNVDGKIGLSESDGTKAKIEFTVSGNYYKGSFGANVNTLTLFYKLTNSAGTGISSMYITIPSDAFANNKYSVTVPLSNELDYKETYAIEVLARDTIGTKTGYSKQLKAVPVFDWGEEDFNFNVPVSINGSLSINDKEIDYIIEQGVSNDWIYRKWNSGIGECWKTFTHSTSLANAWGELYIGTSTSRQEYPFEFSSKPIEQATLQSSTHAGWLYPASGGNGVNNANESACYNIARPMGGGTIDTEQTFYLSLYCIGTFL